MLKRLPFWGMISIGALLEIIGLLAAILLLFKPDAIRVLFIIGFLTIFFSNYIYLRAFLKVNATETGIMTGQQKYHMFKLADQKRSNVIFQLQNIGTTALTITTLIYNILHYDIFNIIFTIVIDIIIWKDLIDIRIMYRKALKDK